MRAAEKTDSSTSSTSILERLDDVDVGVDDDVADGVDDGGGAVHEQLLGPLEEGAGVVQRGAAAVADADDEVVRRRRG